MGLMVWSPLAGGLLSGKYAPGASSNAEGRRVKFDFPPVDEARGQACIAALREVAAKHDTTVDRVALAWNLVQSFVRQTYVARVGEGWCCRSRARCVGENFKKKRSK